LVFRFAFVDIWLTVISGCILYHIDMRWLKIPLYIFFLSLLDIIDIIHDTLWVTSTKNSKILPWNKCCIRYVQILLNMSLTFIWGLVETDDATKAWLEVEPEKNGQSFDFGGHCYGNTTMNLSKIFNNVLKTAYSLPLLAIIHIIFLGLINI